MDDFYLNKDNKDALVLVGFGKYDLGEVFQWKGTEREIDLIKAPLKWPARWRRAGICDKEEINLYFEYLDWISRTGFRDGIIF